MWRRLLLPLCALPLALSAGDPVPWTVGGRALGGFLVPHRPSIWVMVDRHARAAELYAQRPFSGGKAWHGNYVAPAWGLSALWSDVGAHDLGRTFRLLPYLDLPLVRPGRWSFNTRIGWGLGVVQRPFDRVENYKQHAIAGRLNLAVQWAFAVGYRAGPHRVDLGLAMDHLSNGAMQQPNLGTNVATLSLGYAFRFGQVDPAPLMPDTAWRRAPRTTAHVLLSAGMNEVYPLESGRRSVLAMTASAYRRVSPKSAFGAGLDLFNKGTLAVLDTSLAGRSRVALTQVGAHVGYALLLGDLALHFEVGTYLHSPVPERAPIYTRVGMRHRIGQRLMANFTLKSHVFVADHFELGLGYRLR